MRSVSRRDYHFRPNPFGILLAEVVKRSFKFQAFLELTLRFKCRAPFDGLPSY